MCARIWPLCMPVYSYCGGEKTDQIPWDWNSRWFESHHVGTWNLNPGLLEELLFLPLNHFPPPGFSLNSWPIFVFCCCDRVSFD